MRSRAGLLLGTTFAMVACGDNLAISPAPSQPDTSTDPASEYSRAGAADDGCSGAARNLVIRDVAIYQTVKIAVLEQGVEVATDLRKVDVVAGRDTMFRVMVSVGMGWVPRPLSARVFVRNGADTDVYFGKATLAADSDESDLRTTFQVNVPKEKIGTDTTYAVETVECSAISGAVDSPRFPSGVDFAALGARTTGGIKIHIVPLLVNGRLPGTEDADLAEYKRLMLAMYPIDDIEMDVGAPYTVDAYPVDWLDTLDKLRALRAADDPARDIYYFGLMRPEDSLRRYCGDKCTMGIGYVAGTDPGAAQGRVAVAAGFGDRVSFEVMPHEIGHNHGRSHAPCVTGGGPISGLDPMYPYAGGGDGVYRWDSRTMTLMTPSQTDIMGYCSSKWISDYSYQGLVERVAMVDGGVSAYEIEPAKQAWYVLLVDAAGPRWGVPVVAPALPTGQAESADILDQSGKVIDHVLVYRTAISDLEASSIQIPRPRDAGLSVRVDGSAPMVFPPM